MRDVYKEFKQGLITWDEAYVIANNNATVSASPSDTDYWAKQMESLGVDAAQHLMKLLGYSQTKAGVFIKPSKFDSQSACL